MPCVSFIADGYTQPGYIQPAANLHEALRFRFRPVLSAQRSALIEAAERSQAGEFDQRARELLAEQLVEWDLVDPAGQPVEIAREAVDRLQPELFLKLYRIVLGYSASDVDPDWPTEQQEKLGADVHAAQAAGKTLGELREERDEKN
jgi:hypothetical protein